MHVNFPCCIIIMKSSVMTDSLLNCSILLQLVQHPFFLVVMNFNKMINHRLFPYIRSPLISYCILLIEFRAAGIMLTVRKSYMF